MKNLSLLPYRDLEFEKDMGIQNIRSIYGRFQIPLNGKHLQVIASNYLGWEHISVSHKDQCPTYEEMVNMKEFFFYEGEIAFQIHPLKKNYVNINPYVLHIWRPSQTNVPVPDESSIIDKYEYYGEKVLYKHRLCGNGEFVAILANKWVSWETVCQIKQKTLGDVEAIQFHINKKLDLNPKKIIIIWKHKNNFKLPDKKLVY